MDEGSEEAAMEKSSVPKFDFLDSEIYSDSAYPISVPSQPPDIRNWFSSYESQHPADAIEGAYILHKRELNESETQAPFEDSRKRKFLELCLSPEKEQPVLSEDMDARDDTLNLSMGTLRKKSTGTDNVAAKKKRSLRQILGDEFLTSCQNSMIDQSVVPEKGKICPRSDIHEEPKSYMLETKPSKEEQEKKCQELSSPQHTKEDHVPHIEELKEKSLELSSPQHTKGDHVHYTEELEEKSLELSSPQHTKQDHVHHTEAKPDENTSETGFVSPKIRPNLPGNREKESSNKGDSDEGRDPGDFRRPMIDKTNHADKVRGGGFRDNLVNKTDISVDGVPTEDILSGKWQCPRKRKPYVGPPLKQLGLERWIRRAS